MKIDISLQLSNTTFTQRLNFGKWNIGYGKELKKKNLAWKRGKKLHRFNSLDCYRKLLYEPGNKIKKQGIYFKPQTAKNVAANCKLHI
jgi:hypothetical protein